jgi:hypothetical protein
VLRAHGADHRGVHLVRQPALSLAPVVVVEDGGYPRSPASSNPDPYVRIGLDVPDVGGLPAVLGHYPQRVAVERLADRDLTQLTALPTAGLEDDHEREGQAQSHRRAHDRVQNLWGEKS